MSRPPLSKQTPLPTSFTWVAKSMRELWHLRAEVFALVSLELSQLEADRRLAALNRHFPTRAPRSGFVGLNNGRDNMWP